MEELITLAHFDATGRQYHIYRIQNSTVAHLPHYHNYYQVCFVTRGEILHGQGSKTVSLGPGDAFIIPPGFSHSIRFTGGCSEMYSLSFEAALFHGDFSKSKAHQFLKNLKTGESVWSGETVRLRIMLDKERRRMLQSLMDCLVQQQEAACLPELSAASSIITSILYLLAQSYYAQPQNAGQFDELVVYNNTLVQCAQYIDQHYREKLSLTGLARQFGLSRSTFCVIFPQFAGMSLRRYIAQKRILEAQILIRSHPEMPLSQVGTEVGYEEASTFYRNFLRVSGVSPAKYRSLCSGETELQAQ